MNKITFKKSGFSILELIIVMVIIRVIYMTVIGSEHFKRDSVRKNAFLNKIKNDSYVVCTTYIKNNGIKEGSGEYFNQQDQNNALTHLLNDTINVNDLDYSDIQNSNGDLTIMTTLPPGYFTNNSTVTYEYKNGHCLTTFSLNRTLFRNPRYIINKLRSTVIENANELRVTLYTHPRNNNIFNDKHLLNKRNNLHYDRKGIGAFDNQDIYGVAIPDNRSGESLGYLRRTNRSDKHIDDMENEGIRTPDNNSILTTTEEKRDPYNDDLTNPNRIYNDNYRTTTDAISPLRLREQRLLRNTTTGNPDCTNTSYAFAQANDNLINNCNNRYMNGVQDSSIPIGRRFIRNKPDTGRINSVDGSNTNY